MCDDWTLSITKSVPVRSWDRIPITASVASRLQMCIWRKNCMSSLPSNLHPPFFLVEEEEAKRRYEFLGTFAKLRKATVSFVRTLSVRPRAWNNSAPTGRTLMKFDVWGFFENPSIKFKFDWSLTKITGTLYEDSCAFMIRPRFILRIRNVSD